jgi:hypothetical protein
MLYKIVLDNPARYLLGVTPCGEGYSWRALKIFTKKGYRMSSRDPFPVLAAILDLSGMSLTGQDASWLFTEYLPRDVASRDFCHSAQRNSYRIRRNTV